MAKQNIGIAFNYFYFCLVTDLPVAESRLSGLNPPNTSEILCMYRQNIYLLAVVTTVPWARQATSSHQEPVI